MRVLQVGLYIGGLYTESPLCLEFFTPAICLSRKMNGTKQKKVMLMQQNAILLLASKQGNTFHNSGLLASLRLKNT